MWVGRFHLLRRECNNNKPWPIPRLCFWGMPTILYYTSVINLTGNYLLHVRLLNRHQINQLAFIHRESTSKNGRRLKTPTNHAKYNLLVGLVKGKKTTIFLLVKYFQILILIILLPPHWAVTFGYSMVLKAGSGCSSFSVNWELFQDRCYQVQTTLVNLRPAMVLPPRMELKAVESSKKLVLNHFEFFCFFFCVIYSFFSNSWDSNININVSLRGR